MRDGEAFVGRDEELALVRGAMEEVRRGRPRAVLLAGESGIGKSAFLDAVADDLRSRGPRRLRVLRARDDDPSPYDPVADALGTEGVAARARGRRIARKLLPEWLGAIPVWGEIMGAVAETLDALARRRGTVPPELEGDEALATLARWAARRPVALVVDDLDRADADGIRRLRLLVSAAPEGSRLLVVAAYAPPGVGEERRPAHRLPAELPRGRVVHDPLAPFGPGEVAAWVRGVFGGATLPMDVVERAYRLTGGHPGALHALLETGVLATEGGTLVLDEEVAAGALGGADRGLLERLGPDVAAVVRDAAALGDGFLAADLAEATDRDEVELEDRLSLAAHYGVLEIEGEEAGPGGLPTTRYRFRSSHLRARLAR